MRGAGCGLGVAHRRLAVGQLERRAGRRSGWLRARVRPREAERLPRRRTGRAGRASPRAPGRAFPRRGQRPRPRAHRPRSRPRRGSTVRPRAPRPARHVAPDERARHRRAWMRASVSSCGRRRRARERRAGARRAPRSTHPGRRPGGGLCRGPAPTRARVRRRRRRGARPARIAPATGRSAAATPTHAAPVRSATSGGPSPRR